jgi:hypothetical protein
MSRIALTPTRPVRRRSRRASLARKLVTLSPRPSRGAHARAGASGARAGPPASPDVSRRVPSCRGCRCPVISSRISPAMSSSRLPVRLVRDQERGRLHDGTRERRSLSLALREAGGGCAWARAESPTALRAANASGRDLAARRAEHAEHEGDVVEHGAPGEGAWHPGRRCRWTGGAAESRRRRRVERSKPATSISPSVGRSAR